MDDGGKLSLSVYTAQKGFADDAENNVLKEYGGSPETTPWAPGAEVFKDIPHVARASSQLALMSLSRHSLAQLVTMPARALRSACRTDRTTRSRQPVSFFAHFESATRTQSQSTTHRN